MSCEKSCKKCGKDMKIFVINASEYGFLQSIGIFMIFQPYFLKLVPLTIDPGTVGDVFVLDALGSHRQHPRIAQLSKTSARQVLTYSQNTGAMNFMRRNNSLALNG
jgi:hypothetical protein